MKYPNMIKMNQFINEQVEVKENMVGITFDLNRLKWIDPSGAVIFLETIENLREKGVLAQFEPLTDTWRPAISYGLTMGILQKLGLSTISSNEEGETYLAPRKIHRTEVYDFLKREEKQMEYYFEYISGKISKKVLRFNHWDYDERLKELFIYVVRELIRNIFDHSEADYFYYGSQYIPSTSIVEMVIADRGVGLKATVPFDIEERWFNKDTTEEAIKRAFTPGITARSNHGYASQDYMNSGFGLAIVKSIISEAGGILSLATSDKAITFITNEQHVENCNIKGTIIRIRVDLEKLSQVNFERQLEVVEKEAESLGIITKPSRRSKTLKNLI
jgi:hypothetical protein